MPSWSFVPIVMLTVVAGYLVVIAAAAVAGAVARGARRERAVDAYEALAVSRFTIPVSVIVPVESTDAGAPLSELIAALLALNYPEFEVIVVAERLPQAAIDHLKADWALEARELFFRRSLTTAPVQRLYVSAADARLMVVEKKPAGRADALNCGVNLARYRYVVAVPPGISFDANALLRLVSPALRDPATVLAVTSSIERRARASVEGETPADAGAHTAAHDYQRLASLRSWLAGRLVWYELPAVLPPKESVIAWRRDAVLELRGFSSGASDPDFDLLARLQVSRRELATGRVVRTSEVFGYAAPASLERDAAITTRRRRAQYEAWQTFWNAPAAGRKRLALTLVLAVELFTPLAEAIVLAGALATAAVGWVSWRAPFLAVLMISFGLGLMSTCALLVRGGAADAPAGRELVRLLLRSPIEFPFYRPVLAWARNSARG